MNLLPGLIRQRNRGANGELMVRNYNLYYALRWGDEGVPPHPGLDALPDPWSRSFVDPDEFWWKR